MLKTAEQIECMEYIIFPQIVVFYKCVVYNVTIVQLLK